MENSALGADASVENHNLFFFKAFGMILSNLSLLFFAFLDKLDHFTLFCFSILNASLSWGRTYLPCDGSLVATEWSLAAHTQSVRPVQVSRALDTNTALSSEK